MFDVFYFGPKPDRFAHKQPADSLEDAADKSRTGLYWYIYGGNDYSKFDFDFVPPPWESHQTHVWANQWQPNGEVYLANKHNAELIYNYRTEHKVHRLPDPSCWHVPDHIGPDSVDQRWCPDPLDPLYIYHFASQWQSASGVTYTVAGATEHKLVDYFVVRTLVSKLNWQVPDHIDPASVDFTWHPNPLDSPYIYHFASQHQSASGVTYTVAGATEIKLVDYSVVTAVSAPWHFKFNTAVSDFDYTWHPNALDTAMCYVFGNQWNPAVLEPTVIYNVSNSDMVRYMDEPVAVAAADMSVWTILDDIVDFDYTWRPNPTDPPYRYVFGNQWLAPEVRPALEYVVGGAAETKYMEYPRATRISQPNKFTIVHAASFDFSWEPDPGDPAYIYVFGNQWYPAEVMPTVEYAVAGATERKFLDYPRAQLPEQHDNHWHTLIDCEWDYSWVPDPGDPAYIYVFGNQWHAAEIMPTVEYHVPGAVERKYLEYPKAALLSMPERWCVPEEINIDNIDFTWHPHPADCFVHHFGSQYQKSTGLTYTTPGATEIKLEYELPIKQKGQSTISVLDIFFVDKGNSLSAVRFEQLQQRFPAAQKIRYANSMLETVRRCVTRTSTNKFWVISSENVYSEFDFAWHAEPWQSYMTHIFGSQWQKWSDTYLVNKWEFERHAKWATALEQFPSLNFVKNQTVHRPNDLHDIYYVDHNNANHQLAWMQQRYPNIKITRFVDNYLDTFKRIMTTATTEYVWITSSICSYAKFDFSWQPEPWQKEMIHVFGSSSQRRGDTFYIHVESFKTQMYELEMLDWFNVINYCQEQLIDRLPAPVVQFTQDSIVPAVQAYQFDFPYAVFTNQSTAPPTTRDLCLWHAKDRVTEAITRNGATTIVPREIKAHLRTQLYDYPYVNRKNSWVLTEKSLDIIFISNGEPDEEMMYHHTEYITNSDVKWIRGVNGRVAAYQAAAQASTTPWFFAVFAKLEVVGNSFPWHDWQPDYWQEPKHYIFNAQNPVNGLEYGHQGMIAYNKNLVLTNNNPGIDFTLSQAHESVPVLSGIARFNQDPWMTWRTAFREVVKLKHFMATQPTLETEHRLTTWLTVAQGDHATWCLRGAADAVDYYTEVGGDYNLLMLSFDWAWLQTRFIQCSNS